MEKKGKLMKKGIEFERRREQPPLPKKEQKRNKMEKIESYAKKA